MSKISIQDIPLEHQLVVLESFLATVPRVSEFRDNGNLISVFDVIIEINRIKQKLKIEDKHG